MRARLIAILMGGLTVIGCNKPQPVVNYAPPAADLVSHDKGNASQLLLKKSFSIQGNKAFRFEIPAHSSQPTIRGSFESFSGANSSQKADVELMLMDEDQYQDFLKGKLETTVNSIAPSSNSEVHWNLGSTLDTPAAYYFVFLNPQKGSQVTVNAEFNLASE